VNELLGTASTSDTYTVTTRVNLAGAFETISFNIIAKNDCPEGPALATILPPTSANNPTWTYYIGRADYYKAIPQWTTNPTTCALTYTVDLDTNTGANTAGWSYIATSRMLATESNYW